MEKTQQTITVLGKTFNSEEERRNYFREELRKKLPELKQMEGFPIGEDEDIVKLSDPPYYTACPNPWLNDFIAEWEIEKEDLEKDGQREKDFKVFSPLSMDISAGKNSKIFNAHSYHTKIPHQSIIKYLLYYTQPGDIVFDGFCGTGMTAVAATHSCVEDLSLKIGFRNTEYSDHLVFGQRKAINTDLSPIATHISYGANKHFNSLKFREISSRIINEVEKELGIYYETVVEGQARKVNYTIWSDIIICNSCLDEVSYWKCAVDASTRELKDHFSCPSCKVTLNKRKLNKVFETIFDELTGETMQLAKTEPIIINYGSGKLRGEKNVDTNDLKMLNSISLGSINKLTKELPSGYNLDQPIKSHGYKYVHQLFTKRNWLIINKIYEKILNYNDDSNIQHNLIYWFTASLNRLNKFNRYAINHKRHVGPLANTLYISPTPTEISPFYFFRSKIKVVSEAKFFGGPVIGVASATQLNIKDNSIDYIFNDPPYGGNIMYSELNFMDEFWLKVFTNDRKEAIENPSRGKGKIEYHNLMYENMREYYRILKPGKWMSVIFSNTNAATWNSIQLAIQNSGFVISDVSFLNTNRPGLHGIIGPTAVKQPLVISCYKPSIEFIEKFSSNSSDLGVWEFIEEHLKHLPVHLEKDGHTSSITERSPKILYDRLLAFYIQNGLPVPIDAGAFQKGLRERLIERDGMFFTNEQVQEYDRKKAKNPEFIQLSILVSSEQDGVLWLKNVLSDKSLAYQDIQPLWMQALAGVRKGDIIPELATILDDNFLMDEQGKWFVPNPEKEADLEKLRTKRLLKQFEVYKTEAFKPKGKIKEVRVEALRAGFKEAYQEKDFKTIVQIGDRIPNNLLMEDEVLLQFYDIAVSRV